MDSSKPAPTPPALNYDLLPKKHRWSEGDFYHYQGYWYLKPHLEAAMAAKSIFQARDDDILLASSMKTGTTWLKALIPSIISYGQNGHDPLLQRHPNELIPSIVQIFEANPNADLSGWPSPRLLRTHLPYSMLSDSIKSTGCRIVYITRDPKDTFNSLYHFMNAKAMMRSSARLSFEEAFESFCEGVHPFGPFHDHVLEYWKESQRRPEKVLFLRYEELKRNPKGEVKKLARFLGRPFGEEEEEEVDEVIWRCSFERLKSLKVNINGVDPLAGFARSSYFRRGLVGDWKTHLSLEMAGKIDQITRTKFAGSGLDL